MGTRWTGSDTERLLISAFAVAIRRLGEREREGGGERERQRQRQRQTERDRQTDTDRQTERQTDRQRDRQTDIQLCRPTDIQTDKNTDRDGLITGVLIDSNTYHGNSSKEPIFN